MFLVQLLLWGVSNVVWGFGLYVMVFASVHQCSTLWFPQQSEWCQLTAGLVGVLSLALLALLSYLVMCRKNSS